MIDIYDHGNHVLHNLARSLGQRGVLDIVLRLATEVVAAGVVAVAAFVAVLVVAQLEVVVLAIDNCSFALPACRGIPPQLGSTIGQAGDRDIGRPEDSHGPLDVDNSEAQHAPIDERVQDREELPIEMHLVRRLGRGNVQPLTHISAQVLQCCLGQG